MLYSVDGAIVAAKRWLYVTPQGPATEYDREGMRALLDILREFPLDPTEAEIESAQMAVEGMVESATRLNVDERRQLMPS